MKHNSIKYAHSDTDLLTYREVSFTVGLKRTSIYERIKLGTFPAPLRLSSHAVRWRRGDIENWKRQLTTQPVDKIRVPL